MKVFITRPIPDTYNHLFTENNIEVDIYEKDEVCPREILLQRVKGVDAILAQWEDVVDKELFDVAGDSLKVVANFATSYDQIDISEAKRRGIIVTDTPSDSLFHATAEAAIALLLSIAKRITKLYSLTSSNNLPEYSPIGQMGVSIRNKTTGIVGMGNVGKKVAAIMHNGFTNTILYTSRSQKENEEQTLEAKKVELEELFKQSDFIFITILRNAETEHLITKELIQEMRPSSIFVSVSPPQMIDEEAVVDAVKSGKIYGAGLDIPSSTLKSLPSHNLLLTSHMSSMEEDTTLEMARLCVENIVAVLQLKPALTPV